MGNHTQVETELHADKNPGPHQDALRGVMAEAERLKREHSELKARLEELNSRVYLSPSEELEKKTIQKLKLQKKDRIAALLVSYEGNS